MHRPPHADTSNESLRPLVDAIIRNDPALFSSLLIETPALATATFTRGAARDGATDCFIEEIGHYIYAGDTALHFAAAAYRHSMAQKLIEAGARVSAKNRRGSEPLHAAAFGSPGARNWNPAAQTATIVCLIEAGADPNARNIDGATPLHRAVRTRCAAAVETLLAHGADPSIRNKNGSTAMKLALYNTGRSGSGSVEARAQLQEILQIFEGP